MHLSYTVCATFQMPYYRLQICIVVPFYQTQMSIITMKKIMNILTENYLFSIEINLMK